jgi:hypothetical protein
MRPWLDSLLGKNSTMRHRAARPARPTFDSLEGRQVMSVTYHGGPVLTHVEVQGVYLGSDFLNNSSDRQQTGALDGFLSNVVNSSYTDALTTAGYGTGRGTTSQGIIAPVSINKAFYLNDSTIQGYLQSYISSRSLQQPDANRLYVVFVEPNVAVRDSEGTSIHDFLGYHTGFTGHDAFGRAAQIRYAVITYPGGTVGNAGNPNLSTLDSITQTASHELGESITDPDINGYFDGSPSGEIGDITNGQVTYLHGYAVQRLADKNDQPITPAGATSVRPVSFILQSNGNVLEHTSGGVTTLFGGISKISDQGVDNNGRAFIDVVTFDGRAFEYHDGAGGATNFLTGAVQSAVAGQGASFVLQTNGNLFQYTESTGRFNFITGGVASISAGTDGRGVNDVDVIFTNGTAYEYSDTSGYHFITSGARAVSAGQQGETDVLLTNGNAYEYRDSTGVLTFLASNVAQITAGTDPTGSFQIDLLYNTGTLIEYRPSTGYVTLFASVRSISKGRAGVVDYILTNGNAFERTSSGSIFLIGSTVNAG